MRAALLAVIAACSGVATSAAPPHERPPRVQLLERSWPTKRLSFVDPGSRRPYFVSPIIIIPHLGPTQGPPPKETTTTLEKRAANARGVAKLVALDRLADALEDRVTDDPDLIDAALARVATTYRALLAAPGFASYATDALMFRAAHALLDADAAADGRAAAEALISRWPKSELIADTYIMLGKSAGRDDPYTARHYFELAIPIARPMLAAFTHLEHADILIALERYEEALQELQLVAVAQPDWRDVVAAYAVRAFLVEGIAQNAPEYFAKLDPDHATHALIRLVDDYLDSGRDEEALVVLAEVLAHATDPVELCYAHDRTLTARRRIGSRDEVLAAARAYLAASKSGAQECRIEADNQLTDLAEEWAGSLPKDADDIDRAWQLALAAAHTPERSVQMLRSRAVALWKRAATGERFDPRAWRMAAAALDAAFENDHTATELRDAANDARTNAASLEHH